MFFGAQQFAYTYHREFTAEDAAAVGAAMAVVAVFALICYAIGAVLMGRVFKKAGVPQWAAWVPVYNSWKFLEIGGQSGALALLSVLASALLSIGMPLVGFASYAVYLVFLGIAAYHIGKKLGKEDWFVLLAIFLPIIWLVWLGFDDSKWPSAKKKRSVRKTSRKKSS